jgi:hypothetical protein
MKQSLIAAVMAAGLTALAIPAAAHERAYPPITEAQTAGIAQVTAPFFAALQEGAYAKAFTDLFAGTLLEGRTVEVQQIINQATFVFETYGTLERWEIFDSECATAELCRLKIVGFTAKGPVFVWLDMWRGNDGWKPQYIVLGDTSKFVFD